jgi:eukaryotic-like serine/threonine-protein kinase
MKKSTPGIPSQVGRYQIVRLLGRGAMGQVLLAHDPVLDRPVAIKHLRHDLVLTPEQYTALTRRMEQEARASARVSHPNLVALHDMGQDATVGLFLVFEYVEGQTLKERLATGPLSAGEAARLSRQLGGALGMAHAASVLHRDIKPENVILSRTGAKVADFGIARLPDSTLTIPGNLLGTPAYSAPEAIEQGSFSPQSDQFSLASTLFEAISGRRAFPGDEAVAVATLVQTFEPPPIAPLFHLDARVDTILARAFAKHPASRYPSCEEFGNALGDALETHFRSSMITQPDGHHRALSAPAPSRRHPRAPVIAAAAAVFVLAASWYRGWGGLRGVESHGDAASAAEVDSDLHPVARLEQRPSGKGLAGVDGDTLPAKGTRRTLASRDADAGAGP